MIPWKITIQILRYLTHETYAYANQYYMAVVYYIACAHTHVHAYIPRYVYM